MRVVNFNNQTRRLNAGSLGVFNNTMELYLANSFSDEEGEMAVEGKTVYINASKKQLIQLAEFFKDVADYVEKNDLCHMHFRDHAPDWNKENFVDVAIELKETSA